MPSHDKTGRSAAPARFAALPHDVLKSPGFLATSPPARAVLLELIRLHNGSNNGAIGLCVREAAERCKVSKSTASRALQELDDYGLIDQMTKGSFRQRNRHASTYRLTWLACDVSGVIPPRRYRMDP